MSISVGKFTLESLTTGMYNEPESCYREYIQNAVDSIDMAVEQGLLQQDESRIEIIVDGRRREISVKDNGTLICRYCGSELTQPKTGRKKQFCCDVCRRKWWNQNRNQISRNPSAIYTYTCKRCGKEFTAYGNSHRQYCCYECFISDRYWGGETPTKSRKIDTRTTAPTVVMIS